jgi:hypothetical protein
MRRYAVVQKARDADDYQLVLLCAHPESPASVRHCTPFRFTRCRDVSD